MSWVKKEEIKKFLEEDTLDHIDELKEMTHKEAGEEEIVKALSPLISKAEAKALKDKFHILRKDR